eukprot:742128-Prorocentrum_lima.AAC.1
MAQTKALWTSLPGAGRTISSGSAESTTQLDVASSSMPAEPQHEEVEEDKPNLPANRSATVA